MLSLPSMKVFAVISLISAAFVPQHIIRHREKEATSQIPFKPIALAFAVASLTFVLLIILHMIFLLLDIYPDLPFIFFTHIDLPLQFTGIILICASASLLFGELFP